MACYEAQTGEAYHNPEVPAWQTVLLPDVAATEIYILAGLQDEQGLLGIEGFKTGRFPANFAAWRRLHNYSGLLMTPHAMRGGAPLPVSLATA